MRCVNCNSNLKPDILGIYFGDKVTCSKCDASHDVKYKVPRGAITATFFILTFLGVSAIKWNGFPGLILIVLVILAGLVAMKIALENAAVLELRS